MTGVLDLDDGTIFVSSDFASAALFRAGHGIEACRGEIAVNGRSPKDWRSELPILETERFLRAAAKRDGFRVTFFRSQATE